MAEAVFATIETELLWQHTFIDLDDARSHLIDYLSQPSAATERSVTASAWC
jgi:hypothetical protein